MAAKKATTKKKATKATAPHKDESGLNLRQLAFVDAYLGAANYNATKAAILAGYSESSAGQGGHQVLKNIEIQEEIRRRLMDKHEIEARLNEHARGDMADLLDDQGKFSLAQARQSGKSRLLKELSVTFDKTTKKATYKYKIHDPQTALDKLARMQGLYVDKLEQSGEVMMRVIYGNDGDKEGIDNPTA